jgi:uncharacterized protein involved in exopolysaccharide biosynthesis
MSKILNNRPLAISEKVFECLLFAYPKRHRNEYGSAMAQLFRDQCRDAWNESRGLGLMKLWLRVLPDLAKTSLVERISNFNPKKSMSEKIAALSRPARSPLFTFFVVFTTVFLLVLIVSGTITFILPESYASTARVEVEPDANDFSSVPGSQITPTGFDPYFIQTTFEIMQSQVVLDKVIAALDLNAKWGKKYNAGEKLRTNETMAILKGNMMLTPVRNTKLIAITVYSDDANEAAQIANAIADSYKDYRVQSAVSLAKVSLNRSQQEFQNNEVQVKQLRAEVSSLGQQLKVGNEISANPSAQEQSYWDKKEYLDGLLEAHKTLYAKIEAEKVDAQIPKTSMVQLADKAEPSFRPVRPNKPLNIFCGAVAGGFLGLLIGVASALVSAKVGNRGRKNQTAFTPPA